MLFLNVASLQELTCSVRLEIAVMHTVFWLASALAGAGAGSWGWVVEETESIQRRKAHYQEAVILSPCCLDLEVFLRVRPGLPDTWLIATMKAEPVSVCEKGLISLSMDLKL